VTVSWSVSVVSRWVEECSKNRNWEECWDEAFRKYGVWFYSATYENCLELNRLVEEYLLREKNEDFWIVLKCLDMFCGILVREIEYDERVYSLLIEALEYISKKYSSVRHTASVLAELVRTAKRLKSSIKCSG